MSLDEEVGRLMKSPLNLSTRVETSSPLGARAISDLCIGFIGAGRLAAALAVALTRVGVNVAAVASRNDGAARALATIAPECKVLDPQAVAETCNLVFVTTADEAIQRTVETLCWRPGMAVVHCSGATDMTVLAKAASDGAAVGGFHPMQSFTDPIAAAESLAGCTVSVEAEGDLLQTLGAIAAALGCAVNRLPANVRALYHAAAGYPSQYINVILFEAVKIWASWGATEAQALRALIPLVRGTLQSIEARGLAAGMPGPVSRGDAATVASHVSALEAQSSDARRLYVELCYRSLDLALKRPQGLDVDAADRVRKALAEGGLLAFTES
ncbi:DUF2520 domain-containing protein [Paraburkholderia sp. Ac-20340]|uniref:Rossmann-like and DUF2520 domain-containing protein n=1 Tax=Paraburkholderia sp. Ac-20340 TaxID=2703888 RepID=UPI00197F11E3|nr:DUF2520 domain-containing protein [Paraburkholderia sp. Ac-20340]MBN3858917.1 DUF2520 domain-containing protein [Paraburkholderia sp. Ac-20340]